MIMLVGHAYGVPNSRPTTNERPTTSDATNDK